MAITRRQFIKRTGLATAGSLFVPRLLGNGWVRDAFAALEDNNRYFVVIFLDGGNDGLNTVIPAANGSGTLRDDYNDARGNINITPAELTGSLIGTDPGTGAQLGIHPGFDVPAGFFDNGAGAGGLKALYDLGKVAVIQGCGYPEYSLSHDESRTIWQAGLALGSLGGTGWVGRHLASQYNGSQIPAVNISDSVVGEFRQTGTSVLAVRDLDGFEFPFDGDYPGDIGDPLLDIGKKAWAFRQLNLSGIAGAQPSAIYIGNTGNATLESAAAYQSLSDLYNNDPARAPFEQLYTDVGRSLARDLREVARVINGVEQGVTNVNARFFQVSNGGYDTHSDQGGAEQNGQHFGLHAELGAALKVFYDDLAQMGVINRVCVLVWSEFSRRIPQNDNGTDHGSQGPMFVIGGSVNGGVYGNHPNINELALDNEGNTEYTQDANPFRSTDFRDVYGTVLKHWVNLPQGTVQGLLPLDNSIEALSDPAHYWRSANFDLGFV
ncbi:MAG: DUF1501 domain-containing protein [Deltaproteobacteria bacterium]|nr:DUF1501 domain-containing protein [Deltaproteobacteria bacterium]